MVQQASPYTAKALLMGDRVAGREQRRERAARGWWPMKSPTRSSPAHSELQLINPIARPASPSEQEPYVLHVLGGSWSLRDRR